MENGGSVDLEDRVRARLRQLRFERGLTLGELAAAAGMAASTLSRLESGSRRISLTHVTGLARALDVEPEALTSRGPASAPATHAPQTRDGKLWWPLNEESTVGPRAYRVRIPADLREPVLHGHEGHQWLYVLEGRARVVVGRRDTVLVRGEAAEFHTWLPHWVGAVDGPVDLLVIFSADGRPLRPLTAPPPAGP